MAAKVICVLRSGGEYKPEHVRALAAQVPSLICLADALIDDVPTILLNHAWPTWWAKMEMFRPDIKGDVFYIDLDTVIKGDISDLVATGKTTMLADFYHPNRLASGLMYITEVDREKVWEAWYKEPDLHIARCGRFGDQKLIGEVLHDAKRWQDTHPERVISYKTDYLKDAESLDKAGVICFHGKPRPWDAKLDWIPDYANYD